VLVDAKHLDQNGGLARARNPRVTERTGRKPSE